MNTFNDVYKLALARKQFREAYSEAKLQLSRKGLCELEELYLTEGIGQNARKWLAGAALGLSLLGNIHAANIPGLEKMDEPTAQRVYDTAVEYTLKGNDTSSLKNWLDDRGYDSDKLLQKAQADVGEKAGKFPAMQDGRDFKVVRGQIVVEQR